MKMQQQQQKDVKVVLLGDSGVGKSSLVLRFINNEFRPYFETTLGAAFTHKEVTYQNMNYKYLIWDTAGQEKYKALTPLYYKDAQVAILVYDVSIPESYNTLKNWVKELRDNAQEGVQMVFVGNKVDMLAEGDSQRHVQEEAARENALYVQTSAKTGQGVTALFDEMAKRMHENELLQRERALSREKQILENKKVERKPCC